MEQRHRSEWEREAVCGNASDDIKRQFFPEQRGRPAKYPEWKEVCYGCPVRLECLNYAIVHGEKGNWGGTTESERAILPRSFVDELTQISKSRGWFEAHPDPYVELQRYQTRQQVEDFRIQLEWEAQMEEDQSPLDDKPVAPRRPELSQDQEYSLSLLGFY